MISEIEIAVLSDNQASEPLKSEHGLAFYIKTSGKRILFDTGQGEVLSANALSLGIDLSDLDAVVLSHGHYDHTGGLPYVLSQSKEVDVYFHPDIFSERYSMKPSGPRSIRMPESSRRSLENHPQNKRHSVSSPAEIYPNIFITGPIPRLTDYEDTGGSFYLDAEGKAPDLIKDDQALWLETKQGLVIVLGCCHAGLANTINYILKMSKQECVHTIMGGLHLLNADRLRMDKTIAYLQSLKFNILYPCHCTGEAALVELQSKFANRTGFCQAGLRMKI